FFRMLEGRGDTIEVLYGPQTHEKIEELPQRHVERTDAASHWRGQRTFDSHVVFAERFYCILRQPFTEFVLCCLAGEHLKPCDLFSAAVCFFDCGIEHTLTRGPDVRPGSISSDKRNDRLIRDIQCIGSGNLFTCWRSDIFVWHKGQTLEAAVFSRNRSQHSMGGGLCKEGLSGDAGLLDAFTLQDVPMMVERH